MTLTAPTDIETTIDDAPLTAIREWLASYLANKDIAVAGAAADYFAEQGDTVAEAIFRSRISPVKIGRNHYEWKIRGQSIVIFHGNKDKMAYCVIIHNNTESLYRFFAVTIADDEAKQQEARAKKQQAADAKANWSNPYAVGTILVNTWGYDATYHDFSEIVAVGPRSVTIQRITKRRVNGDYGSSTVQPIPGSYMEEPQAIRITFRVVEGKLAHSIPADNKGSWRPATKDWYAEDALMN